MATERVTTEKVDHVETPEDVRKLNWQAYEAAQRIRRGAEMLGMPKLVEEIQIVLNALMVNESLRSIDDLRIAAGVLRALESM
jgi:hypothetical protein